MCDDLPVDPLIHAFVAAGHQYQAGQRRQPTSLGLVEMRPHRGAWVRKPSKDELVEAVQVRGVLEAFAAEQAATIEREALALVEKQRQRESSRTTRGGSVGAADFIYDRLIAEAAARRALAICEELRGADSYEVSTCLVRLAARDDSEPRPACRPRRRCWQRPGPA